MERYRGVHGKKNMGKVCEALVACGAQIVAPPDVTSAPYELRIRTPGGKEMDLVCYAFTANKYGQRKRPSGEHRFQLKYKDDFSRYHDIFFDPSRQKVTLMFGVHHEMDLFICVDPQMHNPTWFSRSIEFKERDLVQTQQSGWHSWERERSNTRRKEEKPLSEFPAEILGALTPENFLRYIAFEQLASGMDTGERSLVWERTGPKKMEPPPPGHPLEALLGLSTSDILDVVQEHFRLLVAVRGAVAEYHLGELLRATEGVTNVRALDEDNEPDFVVNYRGREQRIECKNTLRKVTRQGHARVDFQKTRASKNDPCGRFYSATHFEILAACLHPISERWEFKFQRTRVLSPHPTCPEKLATNVVVDGWHASIIDALRASP